MKMLSGHRLSSLSLRCRSRIRFAGAGSNPDTFFVTIIRAWQVWKPPSLAFLMSPVQAQWLNIHEGIRTSTEHKNSFLIDVEFSGAANKHQKLSRALTCIDTQSGKLLNWLKLLNLFFSILKHCCSLPGTVQIV